MKRRAPAIGWRFIAALAIGWLVLWLVALRDPERVLTAYLAAWLLLLAIPLGSLCLLMIHALTGGEWGRELRRHCTDAVRCLPLSLLLSLPLMCGAPWLFGWAQAAHRDDWPVHYLNLPFFYLRCAACFACWLILARGAVRRAGRDAWTGYAAGGLILMLLSVSIGAVDWIMSRVAGWHSTALGATLFASQLLTALAFAVWRHLRDATQAGLAPRRQDMANLLLVAALGWGYLAFMDYLTAWISDLPADNAWYLPRLRTDWRWLGATLAVVPLSCILPLLARAVKQSVAPLRWIAGLLFVTQAFYDLWLVLPDVHRGGLAWCWREPLAWLCATGPAICAWIPGKTRRVDTDARAMDAAT